MKSGAGRFLLILALVVLARLALRGSSDHGAPIDFTYIWIALGTIAVLLVVFWLRWTAQTKKRSSHPSTSGGPAMKLILRWFFIVYGVFFALWLLAVARDGRENVDPPIEWLLPISVGIFVLSLLARRIWAGASQGFTNLIANLTPRKLVVACLLVAAAFLLFPPWETTFQEPGTRERRVDSLGHAPLLSPPALELGQGYWTWDQRKGYSVNIDGAALASEVGALAALATVLALAIHCATSKS